MRLIELGRLFVRHHRPPDQPSASSGMPILAKTTSDLYPDVIALGGLPHALQSALREIGSSLTVTVSDPGAVPVGYARVELASRFSQVYISPQERLFLFAFWSRGVCLAGGHHPQLAETARAIDTWVASSCGTADLAAAFRFVVVEPDAPVYERGEEVEQQWRFYMASTDRPDLAEFVAAASQQAKLRQLFPYTSMSAFCFSRCTGYPFTRDTPSVWPVRQERALFSVGLTGGGKKTRPTSGFEYQVVSPSGTVLGRGTGAEAAALVVAHLPPDCGPAVAGTARDLTGAEPSAATVASHQVRP